MKNKMLIAASLCLFLFPAVNLFADVIQTDDTNFINCLKTQLNVTDREINDEDIQSVNTFKCLVPVKPESLKKLKDNTEFYCGEKGTKVFQSGIVIQRTVIYGTFVDDESFVPGIFYEDSFVPGIVKDDTFIDGVIINHKFTPGKFFDGIFVPGIIIKGDFAMGIIKDNNFLRGNFIKDFRNFLPANLLGSKFGFSVNLDRGGSGVTRVNLGFGDLFSMRGHHFNPWGKGSCAYSEDEFFEDGGKIGVILGLAAGIGGGAAVVNPPAASVIACFGAGVVIGFITYAAVHATYDFISESHNSSEQEEKKYQNEIHILQNFYYQKIDKESSRNTGPKDEPKEDNSPSADNQKKEEDNSGGNETQPYQGEPVCSNEPTEKIKKGDACPTPDGDNSSEPPPVVFEIETLQPQNSEDYGKPECVDPKEEDAGTMPGNIPLPDTGPDKPIINGTIDPSENQQQTSGSGSDNIVYDPGCIDPADTDNITPVPKPVGATGTSSDSLKLNNNLILNDKLNTQVQVRK